MKVRTISATVARTVQPRKFHSYTVGFTAEATLVPEDDERDCRFELYDILAQDVDSLCEEEMRSAAKDAKRRKANGEDD